MTMKCPGVPGSAYIASCADLSAKPNSSRSLIEAIDIICAGGQHIVRLSGTQAARWPRQLHKSRATETRPDHRLENHHDSTVHRIPRCCLGLAGTDGGSTGRHRAGAT